MDIAAEVADDIGPFARRDERHGAGPLADGEAFDGAKGDRFAGQPRGKRVVKRRADRPLVGLAGHADEEGDG